MKTASTRAIILGSKNIGEHDKFVFLYTKEFGKMKVVAKGCRRLTSKFTGHLETLNICTASLYFGKNKVLLREIITEEVSANTDSDFNKAGSIMQIAEITNQMLFENQIIEELFQLIEETSAHIKSSEKSLLILISYIIKLLDKIGLMPDHQTTETRLDKDYRNFFQYIKKHPIQEISKIRLRNNEKFYIKNYIEQILQNETQRNWQLLAN